MLSFKHGSKAGGCFVIQHQTEETMAAVLLAWEGEDSKADRPEIPKRFLTMPERNHRGPVSCPSPGEGVCVPVR